MYLLVLVLSLVRALVADASPAAADQQARSLAIGRTTGRLTSATGTVELPTGTSRWPWGLVVVGVLLGLVLVLGASYVIRRRRRAAQPRFEALQPVATTRSSVNAQPADQVLVPDVLVIDLREPRVFREPASEWQVIDLRTTEPEPTPEEPPAAEPGSERALIEQVQRLAAELRESARREVESLNLSPSAEERRLSQSRRTTRELAEALVLASKALDDQASEETPPEDPTAPPPHT